MSPKKISKNNNIKNITFSMSQRASYSIITHIQTDYQFKLHKPKIDTFLLLKLTHTIPTTSVIKSFTNKNSISILNKRYSVRGITLQTILV